MKILDIEGLKIKSINNKYGYNPKYKKFYLTKDYREFKNLISRFCIKKKFEPPYRITINMQTAMDIDNPVKAILDGLEEAEVIVDDNQIHELVLKKDPVKRRGENNLKIYIETIGA